MWVVPIVLPIVLLVVPLGLQVLESHLVNPFFPPRSDPLDATVSPVSLEPVPPVLPTASASGSTTAPRLPIPRPKAVPRPAPTTAVAS